MSEKRTATIDTFINRYNELKRLYFSSKSDPQYDEDGEEIPSCFMSKAQIVKAFQDELKVRLPMHIADTPILLDGTRIVSENRPAPPKAPPVLVDQDLKPLPLHPNGTLAVAPLKPKAKMVHCSVHGKALAIMMEDDILMCENCFKNSLNEDPPVPEEFLESRPGFEGSMSSD